MPVLQSSVGKTPSEATRFEIWRLVVQKWMEVSKVTVKNHYNAPWKNNDLSS